MKNIKFAIIKAERAIGLQITQMSEEFRTFLLGREGVRTSVGLTISSYAKPAMGTGVIYLRGRDKENDLDISTMTFASNKARDIYIKKLITAIQEASHEYNKTIVLEAPIETTPEIMAINYEF